jgi:hypothetical protein
LIGRSSAYAAPPAATTVTTVVRTATAARLPACRLLRIEIIELLPHPGATWLRRWSRSPEVNGIDGPDKWEEADRTSRVR